MTDILVFSISFVVSFFVGDYILTRCDQRKEAMENEKKTKREKLEREFWDHVKELLLLHDKGCPVFVSKGLFKAIEHNMQVQQRYRDSRCKGDNIVVHGYMILPKEEVA